MLSGRRNFRKLDKSGQRWIDPRAPDEQAQPTERPGLRRGDAPKAIQLFDLQADPGAQHDVTAENPAVVERLKRAFDEMNTQPRPYPPQPSGRQNPKPAKQP